MTKQQQRGSNIKRHDTRMPQSLRDEIEQFSDAEGRSLNNAVCRLIELGLEAAPEPHDTSHISRHDTRMPQNLYDQTKQFASSEGRSLNNAICRLIELGLEANAERQKRLLQRWFPSHDSES